MPERPLEFMGLGDPLAPSTAVSSRSLLPQHSLDKIYARRKEEEQARKAHEVSEKKAEQKKEEAKKAAKLNKKQKLSDVLMEHGAKYMALKAAKKTAGDGSIKQKQAVLLAAKKGARAGGNTLFFTSHRCESHQCRL